MVKRANPMAVNAVLTYEIGEAALALGKSPATIRNWIKGGLPVMASSKPYLILGAELRDYLRAKDQATKTPLQNDELYCFSCRAGRRPFDMAVDVFPNIAKTTRLKGVCDQCGASASRIISNAKVDEFARTFNMKKGGSSDA